MARARSGRWWSSTRSLARTTPPARTAVRAGQGGPRLPAAATGTGKLSRRHRRRRRLIWTTQSA
eukprot:9491925-Pyramimonas_sp.AAC.2